MEIQIRRQDVEADEDKIRELVDRELGRFYERLTRVELSLRDENGAKGGVDTRCLIEVRPRGFDPLTAEDIATNAGEAVSGAVKKLERVLDSRIGKLEDGRR
ncbi:MAG: HPF/RaiA family ribosome-associated protein [Planctomycetota bacterium]